MGVRDSRAMMRTSWKSRKSDGTYLLLKQSDFNEVTNTSRNLFDTLFGNVSKLTGVYFHNEGRLLDNDIAVAVDNRPVR